MSFLRFIAVERWGPFGASYGPFGLAYALARDSEQPDYYRRLLRDNLDWFEDWLPVPDRFHRRPGRASTGVGVCWFRAGARQHIARMRDMCGVLEEVGYPIVSCWSARPGRPIYQDNVSVVVFDHKRPAHMCW